MSHAVRWPALVLLALWPTMLVAQPPNPSGNKVPGSPFNLLNDLGGAGKLGGPGGPAAGRELELTASYEVQQGGREGRLHLKAVAAPTWHVYSITQQRGGPQRSQILVGDSPQFEVTGEFQADRDPYIKNFEFFDVPVEEHDEVTWTAPIRLAEGVEAEQLQIQLGFRGQVCQDNGSCIPVDEESIPVEFTGYYSQSSQVEGTFRVANTHAAVQGYIQPQTAAPGDTVQLVLTVTPDDNWHVYARASKDPEILGANKPTLLVITKVAPLEVGQVETSGSLQEAETGLPEYPVAQYYEEPVQFTVPLKIPADAQPGDYTVAGLLAYQTCTKTTCDLPVGVRFQVTVPVASASATGTRPVTFTASTYRDAAELAKAEPLAVSDSGTDDDDIGKKSLAVILGLAFLAGLILNVMPCVLPVIGLKIMSFVQQAGEDRLRIFSLNMWFSFGLLAVFAVLATFAAFLNFGWGEQFTSAGFSIVMAAIVFAFALSFLGVWEVPIPGFVGASKASNLAAQEGPVGAFSKGALTTVLATPCSGPFLGPAVGWAIVQPVWLTYATFLTIGLGMASPYLLIGAFPRLINLLPKPGAWMDTFKQLMGFVLLGTVVFIISFLPETHVIATLILLVGLGMACWLVGRMPITASTSARVRTWGGAAAITAIVAWLGFGLMNPAHELPWRPYTRATLDQHIDLGHTVLVDFTADW